MRIATLCLISSLFFFAAGAQASAPCDTATTQAQLNECAAMGYREADAGLNAAYRDIMVRLQHETEAARRLAAAQRAWIAFRDAECRFVGTAADGGSAQPMAVDMCLASQTRARTQALRGYLKCEEGDLSCPVPGAR